MTATYFQGPLAALPSTMIHVKGEPSDEGDTLFDEK
jgi:hypothetical protein